MREDISLLKALEEMGFEIDTEDFCTQSELCYLAFLCLTQLFPKT